MRPLTPGAGVVSSAQDVPGPPWPSEFQGAQCLGALPATEFRDPS